MPTGYSKYTSKANQSLKDICLNTYGSLDFLVKLATDNGSATLNYSPTVGTIFEYDPTLVVSQTLRQQRNTYVSYQPYNPSVAPFNAFVNELSNEGLVYVFINENNSTNTRYLRNE